MYHEKKDANTGSVSNRREIVFYHISQNELNSLSKYNNISIVCLFIGSIFAEKWIHTFKTGLYFHQYYPWVFLTLVPYVLGGIFLWKERGLRKKIKEKSHLMYIDHYRWNKYVS